MQAAGELVVEVVLTSAEGRHLVDELQQCMSLLLLLLLAVVVAGQQRYSLLLSNTAAVLE